MIHYAPVTAVIGPKSSQMKTKTVAAFVTASCLFADARAFNPTSGAQSMQADLVIIERDIFKIDPVEIERAKVLTTIMDGRVV
jgi:hypothetical protein